MQSCTPGADVPQLAVSSTLEEWANSGKSLFQHKRYLQAMHCFERAGMDREVAVAKAYSLREQARAIPLGYQGYQDTRAKTAFITAAEAFLNCAVAAMKANETRVYYRIAGDCLSVIDVHVRAAEAYLAGGECTLAAMSYRKAGVFKKAVEVIKEHRQEIADGVADSIMDVARLDCFRDRTLQ